MVRDKRQHGHNELPILKFQNVSLVSVYTLYQKLTQWLGDVTAVGAVGAVGDVTVVTVVMASTTGTGLAIIADTVATVAKIILERR